MIYYLFYGKKCVCTGTLDDLASYISKRRSNVSHAKALRFLNEIVAGKRSSLYKYLVTDNVLNPFAFVNEKNSISLESETWAIPLKLKGNLLALPFHYHFILGFFCASDRLPKESQDSFTIAFDTCMSFFNDYGSSLRKGSRNNNDIAQNLMLVLSNNHALVKDIDFEINYESEICYSCKLIKDFLHWLLKGFLYCKIVKEQALCEASDLNAFFANVLLQKIDIESDMYEYCKKEYNKIKITINEHETTAKANIKLQR